VQTRRSAGFTQENLRDFKPPSGYEGGAPGRPVTALPQALAGYAVEFGCSSHLQRVLALLQDVSGAAEHRARHRQQDYPVAQPRQPPVPDRAPLPHGCPVNRGA